MEWDIQICNSRKNLYSFFTFLPPFDRLGDHWERDPRSSPSARQPPAHTLPTHFPVKTGSRFSPNARTAS